MVRVLIALAALALCAADASAKCRLFHRARGGQAVAVQKSAPAPKVPAAGCANGSCASPSGKVRALGIFRIR